MTEPLTVRSQPMPTDSPRTEEPRVVVARYIGQSGYVRAINGDNDRAWQRMLGDADGLIDFLGQKGYRIVDSDLALPSEAETGLRERLSDIPVGSVNGMSDDRIVRIVRDASLALTYLETGDIDNAIAALRRGFQRAPVRLRAALHPDPRQPDSQEDRT